MPAKTYLTVAQRKECLALGASPTEISELEDRGYEFTDILDLCQTAHAARVSEKETDATRTATAGKRALRPENERHPAISVYSYPEGDVARPRPRLKCPMFWLNEPVEMDTTTARELELFNEVAPGRYRMERPDGSQFRVEVFAERDEITNKPSKMTFSFDTRNGLHRVLPSRVQMLQTIIEQQKALVLA